MINEFLKTYKDGHEVFLNDSERDEIVEEIQRLNNIINEIKKYFEDLEIFAPSRDIKYDILDIIDGSDKE